MDSESRVPADARHSRWLRLAYQFPPRYRVVWAALAALLALIIALEPATVSVVSLKLVTALAGVLILASLGELIVVIIGSIDLSVPSVMTLATAIMLRETSGGNRNVLLFACLALLSGVLVGLVNGALVSLLGLNALIVTLATNGIIGGAVTLWTGVAFSASGQAPAHLVSVATATVGPVSATLLLGLAGAGLVALILYRTRAGRRFIAAGANPRAARMLGVNVKRNEVAAFAVAGLLYASAGLLLAGLLGTPDVTLGNPYQLSVIVAVAVAGASLAGGPASISGLAGASVFLCLIDQAFAIRGFSSGVQLLAHGAVLVLALAVLGIAARGTAFFRSLLLYIRTVPPNEDR